MGMRMIHLMSRKNSTIGKDLLERSEQSTKALPHYEFFVRLVREAQDSEEDNGIDLEAGKVYNISFEQRVDFLYRMVEKKEYIAIKQAVSCVKDPEDKKFYQTLIEMIFREVNPPVQVSDCCKSPMQECSQCKFEPVPFAIEWN